MRYRRLLASAASPPLALLLGAAPARAQMAPPAASAPGGMQPPPAARRRRGERKKARPKRRPRTRPRPADLEPLAGYAEQSKRRMQIFELDGYLRLRTDFMHKFFLGQGYTTVASGNRRDLTACRRSRCRSTARAPAIGAAADDRPRRANNPRPCAHKNIGGANMRLRLEPTINVTDQVRVHAPDRRPRQHHPGLDARLAGRHRGYNRPLGTDAPADAPAARCRLPAPPRQYPPEIGQNGFLSSIRAKRAWAEVDSEFGSIRFGRMPWHFGRGISYNDGACPDCDGGTTVDRVMALTHDLRPPVRAGLGPRRAGTDDPAADAGPPRSERLPRRPVAGRRRAAADGVDHAHRQPDRRCASASTAATSSSTTALQLVYRNQDEHRAARSPTGRGNRRPPAPQPQTPDQLVATRRRRRAQLHARPVVQAAATRR